MAKSDVARALQDDLRNPGSLKSGEYLEDRIMRTVRYALNAGDRHEVSRILRIWLDSRQDPQTLLAVKAVKQEKLLELVPEIEALREDVRAGRVFQTFYLKWIDEALCATRSSGPKGSG